MSMKRGSVVIWLILAILIFSGCGKKDTDLDPKNPASVVIWHYYNGSQKEAFDALIDQFNETEGVELGIIVSAQSKGSVDELAKEVEGAAAEKAGAGELPDAFATYADQAYELYKQELLVDLQEYFSDDEQKEYVSAFFEEGKLGTEGLYIMPVAKSTELFYLNETSWEKFAKETGAEKDRLITWEGIVEVSKQYYDWSGGKAFFGRDAFANYLVVGSHQLGSEIFTAAEAGAEYQLDEQVMRRLWDNYCNPYLKGYFGAYGRFRSDDVKTGDLVACVGSTSSISYYPKEVTLEDGTTYPIEGGVYQLPNFEGTESSSVQQGAGMAVIKSNPKREKAAAAFLKWFTDTEQNTQFCVDSGYLPVKIQANTKENMEQALQNAGVENGSMTFQNAILGMEAVNSKRMCTDMAFASDKDCRGKLTAYMTDWLDEKKTELNDLTPEEKEARMDELFEEWLNGLKTDLQK